MNNSARDLLASYIDALYPIIYINHFDFKVIDDIVSDIVDGRKVIEYNSELELENIYDYDKYISEIYVDNYPLLVIDYYELYDEYYCFIDSDDMYDNYPYSIIRKAIKTPQYIDEHAKERSKYLKYEKASYCSENNYKFMQSAKFCGCFSCGKIFKAEEITDWQIYREEKKDGYVFCPKCGEDTVIMDSQGYEISEQYLKKLIEYIEVYA